MKLIDVITDWEKKHELFERGCVRGFDFYSYLRRELVNTAVNSKNGVKADPFASKGQKATGLKLFLKLLKRTEATSVRDADLLILCHSRRQRMGDVYESVFTDFLEEEFPNSVTLERLFDDHSHFEPAMTKNLCYTDRLTLMGYIHRLLAKRFRAGEYEAIKKEVRAVMDVPFDELEKAEGIDIRRGTYYERAAALYYFRESKLPRYKRFLDRVKPKALVEVVSKSVDAMLLNELCHERGIPVIELQHSLLGPIAKYPEGINEKQSPDYYLSYSDYWSDYQTYPIPESHVFSCGSPYFERQVMRYKAPDKDKKKKDGVKTVLFISGLAYGDKLSRVAVELKQSCGDKVNIIYKLHPDEFGSWRELYPALTESGIRVVDSRDVSIYEFFNDADAQVGVFSTAIYEGIAFDIDTYILNIPFAAEFIDFCRDGYGTLIEDGAQLGEALLSGRGDKESASGPVSERFWKSGAKENIISRIHEIVKI